MLMLMDGQVKFFSPQSTAGVSQEKDLLVISQKPVGNGDLVSKVKKNKKIKT